MLTLAKNPRANFDYDIKQTFVAGLVLSGAEVKSLKAGDVSLTGAYAAVSANGISLINAHIGPYKHARTEGYDPAQTRRLLLKKSEINELLGKERGLIIVPLEIFQTKRGWLKVRLGLGRTKKKQDKRAAIKKREIQKEIKKLV